MLIWCCRAEGHTVLARTPAASATQVGALYAQLSSDQRLRQAYQIYSSAMPAPKTPAPPPHDTPAPLQSSRPVHGRMVREYTMPTTRPKHDRTARTRVYEHTGGVHLVVFRNGTYQRGCKVVCRNRKELLDEATVKLALPFACRRLFDGYACLCTCVHTELTRHVIAERDASLRMTMMSSILPAAHMCLHRWVLCTHWP